jgi:hypothetical protein
MESSTDAHLKFLWCSGKRILCHRLPGGCLSRIQNKVAGDGCGPPLATPPPPAAPPISTSPGPSTTPSTSIASPAAVTPTSAVLVPVPSTTSAASPDVAPCWTRALLLPILWRGSCRRVPVCGGCRGGGGNAQQGRQEDWGCGGQETSVERGGGDGR